MHHPQHKPRILFLVTEESLGGAQQYVLLLGRAFRDRAHIGIATAPTHGDRWLSTNTGAAGIETHLTMHHLRRAISPVQDVWALCELRKLLKSGDWDIVHANSSKAGVLAGMAAWSLGRSRKTRVLYTAHGWVFLEPVVSIQKILYRFLEWLSAKGRDATIVLSEKERTVAQHDLHISPATLHVIPHGSTPTIPAFLSRSTARASVGIPEDTIVTIGVIANMFRTKGLDILLEACDRPPLRDLPWRLVIIGDGPERALLEKQRVHMTKKDAVLFVGQRSEAQKLLSAFDLFVLPSRKEGLPFALLEAMAAGLPIIATDVGGVKEALGAGGLVVPSKDPVALATAIVKVLTHPEEQERLRAACTAEAANRATAYNTMVEKTWSVYEQLQNKG